MTQPAELDPVATLQTAGRIVAEMSTMAEIGWAGSDTFAPRNSPRTEWIALMHPKLGAALASLLMMQAYDLQAALRMGLPFEALASRYQEVLELARGIIERAPVVPA